MAETLLLKGLFILTIITSLNAQPVVSPTDKPYKGYYADLLSYINSTDKIDSRIRPVSDHSTAITVTVQFQIISISKLDTFTGSMDFAGRLSITWNNYLLTWDHYMTIFEYLNASLVEQDSIWTPHLVVYNSISQRERIGDPSYRIRLDMDGNCKWLVGVIASTFCTFDITLFPFDKPSCDITFTTWQYKSDEVLLVAADDMVDFSLYNENSEWTIDNSTANLTIQDGVSYLNYTIVFKRNAGFFLVNMILPVIVVGLLNSMTFLLPTESGERMTYAVLLFLWFTVYLDIISTSLPVSSTHTSKLQSFILSIVGLSVLTIFLDIISVILYNTDSKKHVPINLETFVRFLRCRCGGSNANRIIAFKDVDLYNGNVNTPISDGKAPTTVALGTKNDKKLELRLQDFEMPRDDIDRVHVDKESRKRKSDEIDWKTISLTFDYIFFVFMLLSTLVLCGYFLVPLITANA